MCNPALSESFLVNNFFSFFLFPFRFLDAISDGSQLLWILCFFPHFPRMKKSRKKIWKSSLIPGIFPCYDIRRWRSLQSLLTLFTTSQTNVAAVVAAGRAASQSINSCVLFFFLSFFFKFILLVLVSSWTSLMKSTRLVVTVTTHSP